MGQIIVFGERTDKLLPKFRRSNAVFCLERVVGVWVESCQELAKVKIRILPSLFMLW